MCQSPDEPGGVFHCISQMPQEVSKGKAIGSLWAHTLASLLDLCECSFALSIYLEGVSVHLCMPQCRCRGEKMACRNLLHPSSVWALGTELRSSGAFTL